MGPSHRSRLALCIPARNAERHLPRLLESVRDQTRPFDEVLLFDDASGDRTSDLARSCGVEIIRSEVNVGPSIGKNRLAERSSADWVHFHDADDWLAPDFVARARAWIERDEADVVLFATEDRDESDDRRLGSRTWDDRSLRSDPVRYCILNTVTNCGLYRRSTFVASGGFVTSPGSKYNEDQAMHLNLALNGLRFRADDYAGVLISQRRGSMSSGNRVECARSHYEVMASVVARTGDRYRQEIGERLWHIAGVLGGYKDWRYARKSVELACELGCRDPDTADPLFRLIARVTPFGAVVIREACIRIFKPALRRDFPVAESA